MVKPQSSWALKIELQVGCSNSFMKQLRRCSRMEQNEWSGFAETKVQRYNVPPAYPCTAGIHTTKVASQGWDGTYSIHYVAGYTRP